MNPEVRETAPTRRRSLRIRLAVLVMGTSILPLSLAFLFSFPIFRWEVSETHGASLAREAAFLAAQVKVNLRAGAGQGEARRVVDSYRPGRNVRAYLYDSTGGRLAGLPDLPLIASAGGHHRPGWRTFQFGRVSYFAGVAVVPRESSEAGVAEGPWYLAVVQPASEVMAPLWAAVRNGGYFLGAIAALAFVLAWQSSETFFIPFRKLRQGAEIISHINLAHRIDVRTGDELESIAEEFNRMAESLQSSYGALEGQVREATTHVSEERNRLAGVLRTMTEGVVMTNEAGMVVLLTPRARVALGERASSGVGTALVNLLPADRLEFHLNRIRAAWRAGRDLAEPVLFPLSDGRLLRGMLSAVRGPVGELAGFLFVFRDLRVREDSSGESREVLREIPRLLKGPASTLGSLAEVLEAKPDMAEDKRRAFLKAVGEEIARVVERLHAAEAAAGATDSVRWPSLAVDPRDLLAEAVGDASGVRLCVDLPPEERFWVLVEPYSWVRALSAALRWIRSETPSSPVDVSLTLEEEAVVVTLRVQGAAMPDPSTLPEESAASADEEAVSLGEIVGRNRGEIWVRPSPGGGEVRLAWMRSATSVQPVEGIADEQPEFYDFDLFLPHSNNEPAELLNTPLSALEYVVFDTETTGLSPSEGDEIVSISGVRIRRGKIVFADTFNSLINPRRNIPEISTTFHGIDDDSVRNAPTLDQILPQFGAYVGSSILVAHNAAFDKKFLDLGAMKHGIPAIGNPMLDTLLLSYGLHRDFQGHNLDAIARRLGVEINGRHTSLGDSLATAEIFLCLLPLLSSRGVVTLGDAKAFCDKMLLWRWQTSRY